MSFEQTVAEILHQIRENTEKNEKIDNETTQELERLIALLKNKLPDTPIEMQSFKSGGITTWIVKIDEYGIEINTQEIINRLQARPEVSIGNHCEQLIINRLQGSIVT